MTEIGEIPVEWQVKAIKDVSIVKGGKRVPKGYSLKDEPTEYPYLRVSDFYNYSIAVNSLKYVDKEIYETIKKYTISKEDIYISIAGVYLGIVGIVPNELDGSLLTENAAKIIINREINQKYLMYCLDSNFVKEQIDVSKGVTGVPKLGLNKIEKIQIPIAKLNEQIKIADILLNLDKKIEITDNLIEKTKKLKKGLMQRLLTKGIGHNRFKDTEIGKIPEEWGVKRLCEITKLIKDGTHNPPERTEEGIPLLSAENIFNNKINFGINEKNISQKSFEDIHKNYKIEKNDVLLTIVGSIGRTAVVKDEPPFTVQRSVAIFKLCNNIDSLYFNYCLCSDYLQRQLKIRANTTAQSGIYLGELSKMSIFVPELSEQQKISSILFSVDEKIEQYEFKKEKFQELKKGLMQKLLTGKIRVK